MKKIAVMLPIAYRGGSLRAAKNIAKSIAFQAREQEHDIQVVFSYVKEGNYNLRAEFDDLLKIDCVLRETTWKVYAREELQAAAALMDIDTARLEYPFYCLPSDGANDFYDCDLWIIISDRLPAPLFPLRKYACVIYDYIQRYVPEIFGDYFWDNQISNLMYSVRMASKVFVTTPSTQKDIISFAGVSSSRVHLLEMDFEPVNSYGSLSPAIQLPDKYFIWTTNPAFHKNHIHSIDALELYFQELGGDLSVVVTGSGSNYFDIRNDFDENDPTLKVPQVGYVRKKISSNQILRDRIQVMGNLSDNLYVYVLKKAKFLWHSVIYDNGTFSAIEAAYLGIPTLSARYPAMEYIDQKFNLNLQFFDPRNPEEMAEALLNMEMEANSIPLPDKKTLIQRDWKSLSLPLYRAILEIL